MASVRYHVFSIITEDGEEFQLFRENRIGNKRAKKIFEKETGKKVKIVAASEILKRGRVYRRNEEGEYRKTHFAWSILTSVDDICETNIYHIVPYNFNK